jgi:uncharacterized membrane protein YccC
MGLAGVQAVFDSLPDWMGTLPNWITATALSVYLGLWIRRELGLKRLAIEADQVQVNAQKVGNEDSADIRDHYAQEVGRLMQAMDDQAKRHEDAMNALEARHNRIYEAAEQRQARCEAEREKLGERVQHLEEELSGVRLQVRMNSAEQVVLLADEDAAPR